MQCSGFPAPCKLCLQSGIECTFDPSLDGRRAGTRLDREALLSQNRLFTALLQVVRFRSSSQVQAIIKCIRDDDPTHDIFATIQECLEQLDDGQTAVSGADGSQPDFQRQLQALSPVEQSAADDLLDTVHLHSDTHGRKTAHNITTPPSYDDMGDDTQPNDGLNNNVCPTCNQTSHTLSGALTPPESAQEHPGQPVADESYPGESNLYSGNAHLVDEAMTSDRTTPSSTQQSNISDLQHNRRGWHFSLCTAETQSAHANGAPKDVQAEDEAHQTDASYEVVAKHAHASQVADAEKSSTIPRISVKGPNIPGPAHNHVSPLYGIQTLVAQEKTPLSDIITGFMDSAKNLLSFGASPSGVLGSDEIDVELFFRDRTQEDDLTVSGWACQVWRSFDDWDVYVRLAQILAYTKVMRWMLVPTAHSYAAIPAILKPRPIQYLVPHHIALDFLPLPPLREALIKNLRDWMTALPAAPLSVNWVRGMDEAVEWDEPGRRRLLSKDFVEHVTNYHNWSIGENILDTIPEVQGLIRLDRV
ncbi:uncharacterized protein Z520_06311 [Fonsecaea multimorphosa CBS 102226]|uniref:Zn(2)-C6 fungal-type domain-containing protein n=1 Tax=Fonsecaea multimorphosa CBS 102226 TaxID=1442371 RepID=A0A0D2IMG6_9EURO|nr:uncharacterized protein Z520_06311 [Fonsecaea multimorphosa CBS 102226]KIX98231.1 hypothetical protein Z520_06311 [Fonsecaea multimorphosa CBS 102226]